MQLVIRRCPKKPRVASDWYQEGFKTFPRAQIDPGGPQRAGSVPRGPRRSSQLCSWRKEKPTGHDHVWEYPAAEEEETLLSETRVPVSPGDPPSLLVCTLKQAEGETDLPPFIPSIFGHTWDQIEPRGTTLAPTERCSASRSCRARCLSCS